MTQNQKHWKYNQNFFTVVQNKVDLDEIRNSDWSSTSFARGFENEVPEKSGIYIIMGNMPCFSEGIFENRGQLENTPFKELNYPIYIGEAKSKSLKARFKAHLGGDNDYINYAMQVKNAIFLFWFLVMDSTDSNKIIDYETLLTRYFYPYANKSVRSELLSGGTSVLNLPSIEGNISASIDLS